MPNWCEGVLKLRGLKKDLLNFAFNNLERYWYDGTQNAQIPLIENVDYTDFEITIPEHTIMEGRHSWVYFKNSKRMFLEKDLHWWFETNLNEEDKDIYTKVIDVRQAWDLDVDYLQKISQEYNLDVKITGFESGMCFIRDIEIIRGTIFKNEEKNYKWQEYEWEVYDPRLGG